MAQKPDFIYPCKLLISFVFVFFDVMVKFDHDNNKLLSMVILVSSVF